MLTSFISGNCVFWWFGSWAFLLVTDRVSCIVHRLYSLTTCLLVV